MFYRRSLARRTLNATNVSSHMPPASSPAATAIGSPLFEESEEPLPERGSPAPVGRVGTAVGPPGTRVAGATSRVGVAGAGAVGVATGVGVLVGVAVLPTPTVDVDVGVFVAVGVQGTPLTRHGVAVGVGVFVGCGVCVGVFVGAPVTATTPLLKMSGGLVLASQSATSFAVTSSSNVTVAALTAVKVIFARSAWLCPS